MGKNSLNLTAIRGEVVVLFWLRPGDEAVELSFSGGGGKVATPWVLEGMFWQKSSVNFLLKATTEHYLTVNMATSNFIYWLSLDDIRRGKILAVQKSGVATQVSW
ncbi:hypothetical protein GO003_025900 [Methylicorpusculum oleiharenae]|uniref:hypothetical protein n=1 Tax=Methylicorpusculum oleiharenae TaxID=1338687 RepID=UPI0013569CDD|nr:hypothetical protein [Methylicorpusculum oleiharenae]MCD2453812.1 hypothetical protein [Methylicorpusculum oleiharenae]